jgi:hypothetical protein
VRLVGEWEAKDMSRILKVTIFALMLAGCADTANKSVAANCPRDGSHLAKNCGEARTFGSMYRQATQP